MMDKKACRVSAAAYPPLDARNGLLHASQVDYLVRTAVKLIDRHRTLVLYIYDRKQAAAGSCAPVWTVFQAKGDYITLARNPDGMTKWRTASFERLDSDYYFVNKCAFYTVADRDRVTRFFRDGQREGLDALTHAQWEILEKHGLERQRQREEAVKRRMGHLPALPRGLGGWLRREIVPAYFVYAHAKKGKAAGVCTACGREITLTGVKHNARLVCPHCGREVTAKPGGRIGQLQDRETAQVVQRTQTGELLVRIIKVISTLEQGEPQIRIWENARQFFRLDTEGKAVCDAYYETADGHWKSGERPVFYRYNYNFYADTCGHVYTANLPGVLAGAPWQYCPVQLYYEHFREPMELASFLCAHLRHPKLEHLCKVGFYNLASDLVYRGRCEVALDEAQNRTHRLLGVGAEDVPFLRELDADLPTLGIYQEYCRRNLKDRQRLLRWQLEHGVRRDIAPALDYMTVHKLIRYLEEQCAGCRNDMQYTVTEYRDYLDMCGKLGCDMGNSFVLYPAELHKAHDKAARRVKQKADARLRRDFQRAYQRISQHLDYERDGMKFLLPATPEELAAEGSALHHCVGGYADRVAKKECLILFLRRCEDESKPFYTVEVRGGEVTQVRGMQNCPATPEVEQFMARWERQVLRGGALGKAA